MKKSLSFVFIKLKAIVEAYLHRQGCQERSQCLVKIFPITSPSQKHKLQIHGCGKILRRYHRMAVDVFPSPALAPVAQFLGLLYLNAPMLSFFCIQVVKCTIALRNIFVRLHSIFPICLLESIHVFASAVEFISSQHASITSNRRSMNAVVTILVKRLCQCLSLKFLNLF